MWSSSLSFPLQQLNLFITIPAYLPTFESQKTEHAILRESEATKPEGGKLPRGGGGCGRGGVKGGVSPPPMVGSFCIFGLQIVQSGAYLERKFRLKIYCIAWKATNLKIPKTERSVFFWALKTSKTERLGKSVPGAFCLHDLHLIYSLYLLFAKWNRKLPVQFSPPNIPSWTNLYRCLIQLITYLDNYFMALQ